MNINRIVELLEDLKSEDVRKRVAAVKCLDKIADALGVEKTRAQLLPFLKEYEDDEEEVMVELAKQFLSLGKFINENNNGVVELIAYFYVLLSYEDFSVLNEGMKSLEALVKAFALNNEAILLLAKKLHAMNSPKAILSASRICCQLSQAIPLKFSAEVTRILNENSNSKYCLVRKETAVGMRYLLEETSPYEPVASSALKKLLKDPQEAVRVAALESLCWRKFPKVYFMNNFFSQIMGLFDQKSWKTRYVLANSMSNLIYSIQPGSKKTLLSAYVKFLTDPELEVAIRSVEVLKELTPSLEPEDIYDRLMPALKPIATHENVDMRRALARSVPWIAPLCLPGQGQEGLREVLGIILKDENAEVKVTLLSNLEPLSKSFSNVQLNSIFAPHLLELLNDKNWKVRKDALTSLEVITYRLGESFINDEKVVKALKEKLSDRVFEVRATAISSLKSIALNLGREWTEKQAVAIISSFTANGNYLYRLTYIFGLKELAPLMSSAVILRETEMLLKMAKDPVANVRSQACLTLLRIMRQLEDKALEDKITVAFRELENDADADVQKIVSKSSGTTVRQIAIKMSELKLI